MVTIKNRNDHNDQGLRMLVFTETKICRCRAKIRTFKKLTHGKSVLGKSPPWDPKNLGNKNP